MAGSTTTLTVSVMTVCADPAAEQPSDQDTHGKCGDVLSLRSEFIAVPQAGVRVDIGPTGRLAPESTVRRLRSRRVSRYRRGMGIPSSPPTTTSRRWSSMRSSAARAFSRPARERRHRDRGGAAAAATRLGRRARAVRAVPGRPADAAVGGWRPDAQQDHALPGPADAFEPDAARAGRGQVDRHRLPRDRPPLRDLRRADPRAPGRGGDR